MEMALVVPLWAIVAFTTVVYPSIGVAVSRFIKKHSGESYSPMLVSFVSFFWPITMIATLAFFPPWAIFHAWRRYSQAIGSFLRGKNDNPKDDAQDDFQPGNLVKKSRETGAGNGMVVGAKGTVVTVTKDKVYIRWNAHAYPMLYEFRDALEKIG